MLKNLRFVLLLPLFLACGQEEIRNKTRDTKNQENISPTGENTQSETHSKKDVSPAEVIIFDTADYSPEYLEDLRKFIKSPGMSGLKLELRQNFIIVNGDHISFPVLPEKNKDLVFEGETGQVKVRLNLKRLNSSSVEYTAERSENGQDPLVISGRAHVNVGFFLGSESEVDFKTGESISLDEYFDESPQNVLKISVFDEEGKKGIQRAKLQTDAFGKNKSIPKELILYEKE